jgi:hypothetical protein
MEARTARPVGARTFVIIAPKSPKNIFNPKRFLSKITLLKGRNHSIRNKVRKPMRKTKILIAPLRENL